MNYLLFLHKTTISKFHPVKIELDLNPMYQNIETYASKVFLDSPTPNSCLPKNINQLWMIFYQQNSFVRESEARICLQMTHLLRLTHLFICISMIVVNDDYKLSLSEKQHVENARQTETNKVFHDCSWPIKFQ